MFIAAVIKTALLLAEQFSVAPLQGSTYNSQVALDVLCEYNYIYSSSEVCLDFDGLFRTSLDRCSCAESSLLCVVFEQGAPVTDSTWLKTR